MSSKDYDSSLSHFYSEILKQIIPAAVLGIVLDRTLKKIQQDHEIRPVIMVVVQILIGIAILYVIENYISKPYAKSWQKTTPGIYFSLFYFGMQFQLFNNLNEL